MTTRPRWLGLAAVVLVGLGLSHYYCFHKGQTEHLAEYVPAIEREKKAATQNHLTSLVRTLRPVSQHPNAIPAADAAELCRQAEEYASTMEQERIPEMREAGNEDGVRRAEALVREARTLIRSIQR
jgi:uncharacterized protein HemX